MKKFILFALLVLPLAFVSCGSDNDEPNYPNQTLVAGSVYSIPGGNTGWTSDNELIASVSTNGVTAERVGETYIRNGSKSFKVTVTGKYNTFKEPCLQWGAGKSTVKNFMTGYTIQSESDDNLFYKAKLKEMLTGYSFKSGKLNLSSVVLLPSVVDAEEMVGYLAERYVYVTKNESEYYYGFATPDTKSVVILQLTTISSQVVYMVAYGEVTSSSAPAQTLKMMKKQIAPASTEANAEVKAEYSRLLDVMPEMNPELNNIK